MVGEQPALPPVPQRPAVMAGNEIMSTQTMYSRLNTTGATTTDIVPSTSNMHKHCKRREPQVSVTLLILFVYFFFMLDTNVNFLLGWATNCESRRKHNFIAFKTTFSVIRSTR